MAKLSPVFKLLIIIAIPLAAAAIATAAKAGPGGGGGAKAPKPKPDTDVPKKVKAAVDKWLADMGVEVTNDDGTTSPAPVHVRWYLYRGMWISIQQYAEPEPEITEESVWTMGPLGREYTYRARFRWVVMVDGSEHSLPLAVGDVSAAGTAAVPGPGEAGIEEARMAAAQVATEQATAWIDAHKG